MLKLPPVPESTELKTIWLVFDIPEQVFVLYVMIAVLARFVAEGN